MGNVLKNVGERAFRAKWWVVGAWFIVLILLGIAASQLMQPLQNSLSIPGTEAQKTLDAYKEAFPGSNATAGLVVFQSPSGSTLADYEEDVQSLVTAIEGVSGVTGVITYATNPSALSDDGTIGYLTVQLETEGGTPKTSTLEAVDELVQSARNSSGLTIEIGGDLISNAPGEILGAQEAIGVVIALIVLVITLGSLVAAGLPILTALLTVGVSMAGLLALTSVFEISSTTPALAVMLGLAVGIDYSLFIVNRYRTFVSEGYSLQEAAGRASATAGNAVVFAAATVVIALASLAVVQIPFMTTMGLAAAATVALAALVALTLIPACLGIVGLRVFGRKARQKVMARQTTHKIVHQPVSHKTVWYKVGQIILRFRKTSLAVALGIILILALPASQLVLGLPTDETAAQDSTAHKSFELISEGFGPGYTGPLLVLVEGLPMVTESDEAAVRAALVQQYQDTLISQGINPAALPPAQQAAAEQQLTEQVTVYAPYYQTQQVAERIAELEGVYEAQAVQATTTGTTGVIQVIPTTGPSDEQTKKLVETLRLPQTQQDVTQQNGATLGVTGTTALLIDINTKLAQALPVYLAVVIGLSLLLLLVAFRSVLIPIKATLGFLLSVLAMFGALVAVFQWGWLGIAEAPGPIVSFIPILAIGILFGLAMDYEFFLVSGMQEAYHGGKKARTAVIDGFAIGSRVVVAAALIMVSVFAGFIGNHDATIQSIGFALAVGILVDAFIVRMVIVPITMWYLGKSAWWLPAWLEKRLPRLSIEGDQG